MSRWTWVGLGTAALAAAVLALGPVGARAADEAPGKSAEKRRHVEVVRDAGGGGHLGVTLEDGEAPGAVVKDVQPDTPAAKAGLQPGDVIVRYQGDRVESAAALARMVRETPSGRHVEMDAGSAQKLGATLEKGGGMHRWAEGIRDGALEDLDIEMPELPEMPDIPDMSAMPAVPPMPPIPPLPRDGEDVNAFRRLLRETGGARKLGIEKPVMPDLIERYERLWGGDNLIEHRVQMRGAPVLGTY